MSPTACSLGTATIKLRMLCLKAEGDNTGNLTALSGTVPKKKTFQQGFEGQLKNGDAQGSPTVRDNTEGASRCFACSRHNAGWHHGL